MPHEADRRRDLILVVDDEDELREFLSAVLTEEGYRIASAATGAEAWAAVRRETPDVILLDLLLPDAAGDEICRALKAAPSTRHVPVIIMTGMTDPGVRELALGSNADEFLAKPFAPIEILARIRSVLRSRHLAEQLVVARDTPSTPAPREARDQLLIVEDETPVREAIREMLAGSGAEVTTASSLSEARAALGSGAFDTVLLDLMLPDGSGLDLLHEIKSHPKIGATPVVIITALGDAQDKARGLAMGADDYLVKPVVALELIARVRRQMAHKRLHDTLVIQASEAQAMSSADALTGLYNRRHLDDALARLVESSFRHHQEISVLMADVDLFKSVNDTHGHAAGDEVLRAIARVLRSEVRGMDWVARYGGEEFVVVLPMTDASTAARVAERIRGETEKTAIEIPGGAGPVRVTLSLGVASLGRSVPETTALLARADRALYEAKRGGRNRVVVDPESA